MSTDNSKTAEKALYEPIKTYLEKAFSEKFGNCHLETTANGVFTNPLKSVVRDDIIFSFLGKKASPDLTGFISAEGSSLGSSLFHALTKGPSIIKDFITVEIKKKSITLQDVYQAKMYGDLFRAKYALLISPKPIPEEIKRLDKQLYVTSRYIVGWKVYLGWWSSEVDEMFESQWLPRSPFRD